MHEGGGQLVAAVSAPAGMAMASQNNIALGAQIFRHEGKEKGHESYDHQDSYKAKIAQAVTLYSIIRIAADSSWLKECLSKI